MGNSIKSVSIFRIEDPELELTEDQIEKEDIYTLFQPTIYREILLKK